MFWLIDETQLSEIELDLNDFWPLQLSSELETNFESSENDQKFAYFQWKQRKHIDWKNEEKLQRKMRYRRWKKAQKEICCHNFPLSTRNDSKLCSLPSFFSSPMSSRFCVCLWHNRKSHYAEWNGQMWTKYLKQWWMFCERSKLLWHVSNFEI